MTATERDEAVLAALRAASGDAVSGEALAASLGVSRVAVAKRVAALRDLGYGIDAAPGLGYRLLSAPDRPLPAEVRPLLDSRMWTRLEGGGTTGSTNDDAKAFARAGAPEGTVVLAAEQTGGRGRLGRAWSSPPGGVYLSAVLRPPLAPADISPLALVAGIGLARAFAALGVVTALKWPNDVYLDGRKLAGILLEMSGEAERVEWVVIGCGINVHAPRSPADGAAYLDDAWPSADPPPSGAHALATAAAAALDGLAGAYADFRAGGFAPLRDEYESRSWLAGRHVAVRDASGDERAAGRVRGIDGDGRLIIETAGGRIAVTAGEVTLRENGRRG